MICRIRGEAEQETEGDQPRDEVGEVEGDEADRSALRVAAREQPQIAQRPSHQDAADEDEPVLGEMDRRVSARDTGGETKGAVFMPL